ncbi:MAG TPA: hypothetical protein VKB93_09245 [Thermoanaerobaculia bacterium]|nr:hypothetical protein [Thermoanaerobaculia bacterium]
MADVLHRIYTHAATSASDTTGGKMVYGEEFDPQLDELLRKTTPEGHETAWVVRRFGDTVCVITSYPDLITDAAGRSGVLNHARLGENVAALLEEVPLDDVYRADPHQRIATYLAMVEDRHSCLSGQALLPVLHSGKILAALLDTISRRKATRFLSPTNEIGELAEAWALLPTGLQKNSSFALNVADGCPVDVIFSRTAGRSADEVGTALRDCVDRFLALGSVPGKITTVAQLEEAVRKASVKHPKKQHSERHDAGTLDPEIAAELQRQYDAMEASLEDYVKRRLDMVESRQPAQSAASRAPANGVPRWLPWSTAGAVLLVILWLAGERFLAPRPENPPSQDTSQDFVVPTETVETRPTISANRQLVRDAIARGMSSGKWAEELKAMMTGHAALVAQPIRLAANGSVSDAAAATLEKTARAIEAKQDLGVEGRSMLRKWLMDVIAASVAAEKGAQAPKVDGNIADVTPALLEDIKDRYRAVGTANAQSQEFQSEVILRWMETLTP